MKIHIKDMIHNHIITHCISKNYRLAQDATRTSSQPSLSSDPPFPKRESVALCEPHITGIELQQFARPTLASSTCSMNERTRHAEQLHIKDKQVVRYKQELHKKEKEIKTWGALFYVALALCIVATSFAFTFYEQGKNVERVVVHEGGE